MSIYVSISIFIYVFNTIRSGKYSKLYVADAIKGRQAADHTCTVSSPGTAQSDATQKCCSKCSKDLNVEAHFQPMSMSLWPFRHILPLRHVHTATFAVNGSAAMFIMSSRQHRGQATR